MSDLNLKYSPINSSTTTDMRFSRQRLEAETLNRSSAEVDEKSLNRSMLKSYFDSLRNRTDDEAKKLLRTLENSPSDVVGQLFGNLQLTSAEQLGKMFASLDLNNKDEADAISAVTGKNGVNKLKRAESIDNVDEVDKTDETDKTKKPDKTEEAIDKAIHDSISKESTEMKERSQKLVDASEKLKEALEEKHAEDKKSDKAYNAAKDFANSYNALSDAIKDSKVDAVSGKAKFIEKMTKSFSDKLNRAGIERGEDGKLSVNKDKFESASDSDREEALGKKDSFTSFMEDQAKQLTAFAQKDIFQRASAYTDGGNVANISEINGAYFNMFG